MTARPHPGQVRTEVVSVYPRWMPEDFRDASSFAITVIRRGKDLWSVQHGTGQAYWLNAAGERHLHPESRDGLLFDYDQALELALEAVESVVVAGATFTQHWRARHHDRHRHGVLAELDGAPVLLH